ncbi:HK97 family phage prohead protease [Nocardiopsis sp. CT-R113]|uniref:HK97 family phage prohead protease n=1 Tax=Nocardiopsis codii TaxID=3065942 RepID=A0ABU7KD77_9ACTN|nr:HK97 family phage prohead protease [Nocardiopsis sp. CT-R113]MEE2040186.1 HK97 family phage prohead protease [Nocardiopsis sp. CT-R113]
MMRTKSVPVQIKAAGAHEGTEDGVVEAIVATYDKDSVGDKIAPGAFEKTLEAWKSSEDPIPFIWSHDWSNPDAHIGVIEEAKETPEGLWIKARLDLEEPFAAKVYRLLKGRRVKQFSFGYEVSEGAFVDLKNDDGSRTGYYELRELKLFEAGPCLVGANQNTSLGTVKTAEVGLTEERVRAIVAEALASKSTAPDDGPEPAPDPAPTPAAADPEPTEPQTTPPAEWDAIVSTLAALSDQVKHLTDQLSQQPTPAPAPDATDDTPEGKSAADEPPAPDPLRAQLADLTAHLADL